MILPDESIETILKAFRLLAKKYNFSDHHYKCFSLDSKQPDIDPAGIGISGSYLYQIVHYRMNIKPTMRVEIVLRNLMAKLKLRYPLDEPKVNKKRRRTKINA